MDKRELEARLGTFVGKPTGPPFVGPELVNEAMIHHWCDAMGDHNPVYRDTKAAQRSAHGGIVAPPTMMQVWIMRGIEMAAPQASAADGQIALGRLLVEAGYPSVVATNCEQEYHRYLRPGDQVVATTVFEAISEEKTTALGTGYFIDTRTTFRDQHGEPIGWMTFRILRFKPAQLATAGSAGDAKGAVPAKPRRLRPPLGHDNAWWWEGIGSGELRIQRCKSCAALRHPPRPMCGRCRSTDWDWVVSKGAGTVYSYVVLHHPPIPGYDFPLPVALIDLDEGTRLVANVNGCKPAELRIGLRVQARIEDADEELKLPFFYPVGTRGHGSGTGGHGRAR